MTAHTTDPFYVSLGYLRPVYDYLPARGESLTPYLALFGIEADDLASPDLRVPTQRMNELFAMAGQVSGTKRPINMEIGISAHGAGCRFG